MNTLSKGETSNDREDPEKISESMSCWVDPEKMLQFAFTEIEEAEKFYTDYATSMGFNVRRSHLARRSSDVVKNRELVCSIAGFWAPLKKEKQLIRKPKPETRCGCQARIRFAHDITDSLYKVTDFNPFHNHALETPDTACILKVNRIIGVPAQTLLDGLTSSGIKTCKFLGATTLPDACINKRWTMSIGSDFDIFHVPIPEQEPQHLRFVKLHKEAMNLCFQASQSDSTTTEYNKGLCLAADSAKEDVSMNT